MTTSSMLGRRPRICVIGAGFSGLTVAERLGRHGMEVTIVEARDRVGGRVHQLDALGYWADMGANWIHGQRVNPIRDLAKKVGAVTFDLDNPALLYHEDGTPVSDDEAEKLQETVQEVIEEAVAYSNSGADIPADKSAYEFMAEQLVKKGCSETYQRSVLHTVEFFGGYIGASFKLQSLKYLWLELSGRGENSFIATSYRDILNLVQSQARQHASIHLGAEVASITTNPESGVDIDFKQTERREQQNSTALLSKTYDAVVVTVPFGCLKERQISFYPDLPPKFTHAIDSVTYGNLEKVYIRFPEAFWATTNDLKPFFAEFLRPEFTPKNPEGWNIGLMSLAAGPDHGRHSSHSTLLFYIYGSCGTHVTNLVSGLDQSDPKYAARLAEFLQPYYSRLPNYDPSNPSCKPAVFLASDWQHDRLAGHGSYTNWLVDDNEKLGLPPKMGLDDAIVTMREGLPERNVYFAGEHTSPFGDSGTVTGAYLSGEAVAERIVTRFEAC